MILSVFGPTASGKSSLALEIAKQLNGEIINCDSVQIYRDFIIGAAQPTKEELSILPHHLYGVLDPTQKISVGLYQKLSSKVISEVITRGNLPIVVGGTSLYLTALIYGLADIPSDQNIRDELEKLSNHELIEILNGNDPESVSRIHLNDRVRLLRAAEAVRLGLNISELHLSHQANLKLQSDTLIIVPIWERAKLYDRIIARTDKMFEQGVVKECLELSKKYPNSDPLESIGYKEISNNLNTKSESELKELISMNTRRFAKRQLTWLRNEPIKKNWIIRPNSNDLKSTSTGDLTRFPKANNLKHIDSLLIDFKDLILEINKFINSKPKGVHIWFVNAERIFETVS